MMHPQLMGPGGHISVATAAAIGSNTMPGLSLEALTNGHPSTAAALLDSMSTTPPEGENHQNNGLALLQVSYTFICVTCLRFTDVLYVSTDVIRTK